MTKNPFPKSVRKIGIASPAGPPSRDAVMGCVKLLKALGLEVVVAPNTFRGAPEKYLSAPLEDRLADLNALIGDESVDAILCARGGSGSAQLLPGINWAALKKRGLPVLGYSDITALHMAMTLKNAGVAVACPMADKMERVFADADTLASLGTALRMASGDKAASAQYGPRRKNKTRVMQEGEASGPVMPVNLTVFCAMAGTPWMPDMRGRILMLEDLCEEPYKIERMLTQLRLAGILGSLAGLVFCGFKKCGEKRELDLIFRKYAAFVDGPVLADFPFGHVLPTACVPWGAKGAIEKSGAMAIVSARRKS